MTSRGGSLAIGAGAGMNIASTTPNGAYAGTFSVEIQYNQAFAQPQV
jgi:hypothetical protein